MLLYLESRLGRQSGPCGVRVGIRRVVRRAGGGRRRQRHRRAGGRAHTAQRGPYHLGLGSHYVIARGHIVLNHLRLYRLDFGRRGLVYG